MEWAQRDLRPRAADEDGGPEQLYVILVDNRRSAIYDSDYIEVLSCIRCGSCFDVCKFKSVMRD